MSIMFAVLGLLSLILFIVTHSGLWLVLLAGCATLAVVVFLTRPTYSRAARLAIARGDRKKKVSKKVTIDIDRVAPVTCTPCGGSCSICLGDFNFERKLSSASTSSILNLPASDLSISSTSTISSLETVVSSFDACEESAKCEEPQCRTLPCGHSYHDKCLVEWIKHEGDDFSCPLCRWKPVGVEGSTDAICAAV